MKHHKIQPKLIDNLDESRIDTWKYVYYQLHDLIETDRIFSKIPNKVMIRAYYTREYTKVNQHIINFLVNMSIIPAILIWKIFLIKFEWLYYKIKHSEVQTLENIVDENFEYFFVLNTRDHIIAALPVIENIDKTNEILIITFADVYSKYIEDFNKLENAKVILLDFELKNLPLKKYVEILTESKNKFDTLIKYDVDSELKNIIKIDSNFIKCHLKKELVQYHLFEKIFNMFSFKAVISIVFTTAFEHAKELKIPTFILQHGIGGGGHLPYMSDYIIAYDDSTVDELNKWTDNTITILPLGSPRFEYLNKIRNKRNASKFCNLYNSDFKKFVTYISEGEPYDNELTYQALKRLRNSLTEDICLIIKLHPREDLNESNVKNDMKLLFTKKELKYTIFIRDEIDFYEILASSDIVISTVSTGILESIAMGVPALQINFTRNSYPSNIDLSHFGWKKPFDNVEILIQDILNMLNDESIYEDIIKKQNWLKSKLFKNYGKCSEVIVKTIIKESQNRVLKL